MIIHVCIQSSAQVRRAHSPLNNELLIYTEHTSRLRSELKQYANAFQINRREKYRKYDILGKKSLQSVNHLRADEHAYMKQARKFGIRNLSFHQNTRWISSWQYSRQGARSYHHINHACAKKL